MQLKVIRADESLTHIALEGRLDVRGVNELQYEFFRQTVAPPKPTLVDISKVTFIASLGMGMLVSVAKEL